MSPVAAFIAVLVVTKIQSKVTATEKICVVISTDPNYLGGVENSLYQAP